MVRSVARSELGTKRTCPVTGRKFYDLGKDPIISPYTGQVVPITAAVSVVASRGRAAAAAAQPRAAEPSEELLDPEAGDVELVSLEDADEDTEGKKSSVGDADVDGDDEDDIVADDDATFIEDDEDSDDDVSDLIDSDISDDEET